MYPKTSDFSSPNYFLPLSYLFPSPSKNSTHVVIFSSSVYTPGRPLGLGFIIPF